MKLKKRVLCEAVFGRSEVMKLLREASGGDIPDDAGMSIDRAQSGELIRISFHWTDTNGKES